MAIQELQTAAARVLHLVRPSDRDVQQLSQSLSLHPHDAEALLRVPEANRVQGYRDYQLIQILWPTYQHAERTVRLMELSLVITPSALAIIQPKRSEPIQAWVDGLLQPNGPHWQARPPELLAGLMLDLARQSATEVRTFQHDLATTIDDRDAAAYAEWLERLTGPIEQLLAKLTAETAETRTIWQLTRHHLRHQSHQLRAVPRAPTRASSPVAWPAAQPNLVKGYAWASAVMVMLMLGWMMSNH